MAIAFVKAGGVNANKAGSITSLSVTVPAGGHAAGNLVVVAVGGSGTASIGFTVADTQGNTYTQIETSAAAGNQKFLIFASVLGTGLSAGNTITATTTVSFVARLAVSAFEFSGATITEDVAGANIDGGISASTTPTVGPITPPSAATLLIAAHVAVGATTITEDSDTVGGASWQSGPLAQTTGGSTGSNIVLRPAYKITASSAAQTYTQTWGTARTYAGALVALQAAVSGTAHTATPSDTLSLADIALDRERQDRRHPGHALPGRRADLRGHLRADASRHPGARRSARLRPRASSIADTLALSDSASPAVVKTAQIDDTLALSDSAGFQAVFLERSTTPWRSPTRSARWASSSGP